jgi:cytochrome c
MANTADGATTEAVQVTKLRDRITYCMNRKNMTEQPSLDSHDSKDLKTLK